MRDSKDELLKIISDNVGLIANKKKTLAEVKAHLLQNRITEGRVEDVLSNPELLLEDQRELALFAEQFYVKTGIESLNPTNWFTVAEMKEAKQYDYIIENSEELIKLPWEITALPGRDGGYIGIISTRTVAQLMKSHILNYNPDIQREAKRVKRNNIFEYVPTINKKNVKEIRDLILKGEIARTTLTFNAAPRTSDCGEELIYDPKTFTLTITEGTRLDILDGYHRCLACQEVYEIDPDIEYNFTVDITNKTTRQAQIWQAQTAKGTRISKARILEMEDKSRANGVIQLLKSESELRGRISSRKGRINAESGELVNYLTLSTAIDRNFKIQSKPEEYEVAEYLTKFFEYLMGLYPEEFGDYKNRNKQSLIYYNKMFAGYVALAAKMQKENIEIKELATIMKKIDFSRSNPIWMKLGILDENGVISKNTKEEKIENYFIGLIGQSQNKKENIELLH